MLNIATPTRWPRLTKPLPPAALRARPAPLLPLASTPNLCYASERDTARWIAAAPSTAQ